MVAKKKKTKPGEKQLGEPKRSKHTSPTNATQGEKPRAIASKAPQAKETGKHERALPVVGIGASAGGLEAIQGLVSNLPADPGIAFVIIQHLPPEHKSVMGSILERHCKIEIRDIDDGEKIKPNCIYLNRPKYNIDILNGAFQLTKAPRTAATNLPIDHFFRSLADDRAEKSIGIILSGTASDGTLGLKAIKAAGGMIMVQDPEQAKYAGMPQSAIETGLVDFVIPVEKMAETLLKYTRHPYIRAEEQRLPAEKLEAWFQKIFILIRRTAGHDFSHYKRSTIRRRIERRMAVHQIENIADYHRYLQENAAEAETLFKDLLITVTSFFRDPEAYEALQEKALIPLIQGKRHDEAVRVWVPGCATGEEAYSLAILLLETMDKLDKHAAIQIFATDIDPDTIDTARKGDYPETIAADVSPQRLERYFTKNDGRYTIKKRIREMIVFAAQNLIKDSPFSRLDLVSCRNLLIYMDADLQKKIIPLFHYTLNPDGFLFLGTAESIGEHSDYFTALDNKWRIFKRRPTPSDRQHVYPPAAFQELDIERVRPGPEPARQQPQSDVRHVAERTILDDYGWPCVFVNSRFDIVYFHGNTEAFLRLPAGEPNLNVLKLARSDLKVKLNTALHRAKKENAPVTTEHVKVCHNDDTVVFDLVVRPVPAQDAAEGLLMVIFRTPATPRPAEALDKERPADADTENPYVVTLEHELQSTREYLETTVEELETSNEELRSSNEELQSTNEELQSTNEELETSREELQSTNEELETVNAELRNKVNQLADTNNDLSNLLASTSIATIFLDNDLRVKRFTPAIRDMFNLITADVGRPITDIAHRFRYEGFYDDAQHVLKHLGTIEKEIRTKDGRWYQMRIMPYRTLENNIDGVCVTFSDVETQKNAERLANEAQRFAEAVVESVSGPLLILDRDLRIQSANRAFYKQFALAPDDIRSKKLEELQGWPIPPKPLVSRLKEFIAKDAPVENLSLPERPEPGDQQMQITARQIRQADQKTGAILLMIELREPKQ
ncbi:MAG: PAS domain-containing protein [Phycisphaerae bacterium]|nr:PAS domain-containing protein [Phycisphaerae bacterium]